MSDAIEAVLRGAGLTDKPGEFDSSIHSWRCEHPETYGPCDCFQELVRELAEVRREAAEKALVKVACELDEIAIQADAGFGYNPKIDAEGLRARAEAYRQEREE